MKSLLVLAFLASLSLVSVADTSLSPENACLQQAGTLAQQQACCAANKGVCGCRAGKIVCCDKSFAEGCTCNRDEEEAISL